MKKFYKKTKGFGVLEVIIATGVIAMGMVGVISLIIQSSQVYYINKSRFTAVMLSQEGIELVRNIRDSNWLQTPPVPWNQGVVGDGSYRIESDEGIIAVFDDVDSIDDANTKLQIDSNGNFQYGDGNNSAFSRIIEVTASDLNGDTVNDRLDVISKVKWFERGYPRTYQTEVFFYNWK